MGWEHAHTLIDIKAPDVFSDIFSISPKVRPIKRFYCGENVSIK